MVVFGSVYYRDHLRHHLQSSLGGKVLEYVFVFFPYVLVRPLFPVTRFSNAGSTHNGRSERHRRFYEITTISVKIFFLWAKYFLGFFTNFMIFLGIVTEDQWPTIHGMFLLNCGTVSLAVFLHTLRFRKILPGPFTFSGQCCLLRFVLRKRWLCHDFLFLSLIYFYDSFSVPPPDLRDVLCRPNDTEHVRVAPKTLRCGAVRTAVEHDAKSKSARRLVFHVNGVTDANQHRMVTHRHFSLLIASL